MGLDASPLRLPVAFFKHPCTFANSCFLLLAPVVQGVDNAIYWINIYPVDSAIGFVNTNPLDSNLSVRKKYPSFEQLGFGWKEVL